MEPTPSYFQKGKKKKGTGIFRNCWCPHYDRCLNQAARRDVLLDCEACLFKDQIVDQLDCWLERYL